MGSHINDWFACFGFFDCLTKGIKEELSAGFPSPSSISSRGSIHFWTFKIRLGGHGDSRESTPKNSWSSFSWKFSVFVEVQRFSSCFPQCSWELKMKFRARILRFAQGKADVWPGAGIPTQSRRNSQAGKWNFLSSGHT